MPTRNIVADFDKEGEIALAVSFWDELLGKGGEGLVVKPLDFIPRDAKKLIQPAIKCRGREYLRIIYGAEYLDNLAKLKNRNLSRKRKSAIKEFALGLEALNLFVQGEPLLSG